MKKFITIRGARTHNLKNIDIDIPKNQLVVITGPSGSGKSSLAFDTLFAEGQRRYVESLSAYARQFLSMMDKPDVDSIEGLAPAISIQQKTISHNPRSTVGTVTEIHDYLRLLFARVGIPYCPEHHVPLLAQTPSQILEQILQQSSEERFMLLAPVINQRKGEHLELFEKLKHKGYMRVRVDNIIYEIEHLPALNPHQNHTIEVVVDRFRVREDIRTRLVESIENSLNLGEGICKLVSFNEENPIELLFSSRFSCPHCGYSIEELEPRIFSFNSPKGACSHCDGLGSFSVLSYDYIVINPDKPLSKGALKGNPSLQKIYKKISKIIENHYQYDGNQAFNTLSTDIQDMILYGQLTIPDSSEKLPNISSLLQHALDANSEELQQYQVEKTCPYCQGTRLNKGARHVYIEQYNLPEINQLSITQAKAALDNLTLSGKFAKIAEKILLEIRNRLNFLINVGLDYLHLGRSAQSLSGGESQRIRLASQIGSGLTGVMYVLDEPSIGLHQRDNTRLLKSLIALRDLGNTLIVVEHDEEAILTADFVVDIGHGAGVHGGEIIAKGTPDKIKKHKTSLTGQYLSGRKTIPIPEQRLSINLDNMITITGAAGNNLKQIDLKLPLGILVCITGVSGSGKSTLINETLYKVVAQKLHKSIQNPAPYTQVTGLELIDKIINIDQTPIGRTPRSNPATYTGIFNPIRELFAATPEARARGYTPGRFSFNVKGGRCEACQGEGIIKVEMHFLPDVYVPCDICKGQRYAPETLEITYKDKNIYDILNMTVEESLAFFSAIPSLKRKLQTLLEVGLGYIQLGQNAITLSGGEAQRVKLAKELTKRSTGKTLYILDEPTTGLHFHDIDQLLKVLIQLRNQGNTIVVIEHNLDVIKTADWIIDLGPEGGNKGGEIIAIGTPEDIAKQPHSYTGQYLKPILDKK